jgi:hypothetical protein
MANEQTVLDWDSLDTTEHLTETDIKKSDNLSAQAPVGHFLCRITAVNPIQKDFKEYSCPALKFDFEVKKVLRLEKPVFDSDGKPVMRDGQQLVRVADLNPAEQNEGTDLYGGMTLNDEVCLFNPKEKEAFKKRRIFVARKIGIINDGAMTFSNALWKSCVGRDVIVVTEWNRWKDKLTGELKQNVKVAFDGYESNSILSATLTRAEQKTD